VLHKSLRQYRDLFQGRGLLTFRFCHYDQVLTADAGW
jgi:hypothetical protein